MSLIPCTSFTSLKNRGGGIRFLYFANGRQPPVGLTPVHTTCQNHPQSAILPLILVEIRRIIYSIFRLQSRVSVHVSHCFTNACTPCLAAHGNRTSQLTTSLRPLCARHPTQSRQQKQWGREPSFKGGVWIFPTPDARRSADPHQPLHLIHGLGGTISCAFPAHQTGQQRWPPGPPV